MRVRIALQPKQSLLERTIREKPVTLYGGAKGGGKSYALRSILLLRCLDTPKLRAALFRRTYDELQENHIDPLLEEHPHLAPYYKRGKHVLELPNGSRLLFRYCKTEADVERYKGREYHYLGIEEAGDWTYTMVQRLRGSNRSSVPGIKPRTILTGNPGGIGHGWLKRLFVKKKYKDRENPGDYAFIKALVTDNEALMTADPGYLERLKAEPNQALRRAFLYGDWDIVAGQFFEKVSRDIHVVKPFPIPDWWNMWASYDYGFGHCASWHWFAKNEDGDVFMVDDLVRAKKTIPQQAELFWKRQYSKRVSKGVAAGHDCWVKRPDILGRATKEANYDPSPTIAKEFAKHKIYLKPAHIARVQGATRLREYLDYDQKMVQLTNRQTGKVVRVERRITRPPRLFFFENCEESFDCISRMAHDPDNYEDVLKVDSHNGDPSTGDDAYDGTRYGIMERPALSKKDEKQPPDGYNRKKSESDSVPSWTVV